MNNSTPPQTPAEDPTAQELEPAPPPPHLQELRPTDWAAWRRHPCSTILAQYLLDSSVQAQREALALLLARKLDETRQAELRAKIILCGDIAEITLDEIKIHYGLETEAERKEREEAQGEQS